MKINVSSRPKHSQTHQGNFGELPLTPAPYKALGTATIIELERWYLTHLAPPQKQHQNTAGKKLRFFGPMNITISNHQCFKKNKTHKTLTIDHATISWIGNYGESTPDPCTLQSLGTATIIELERWYLTHLAPPQKQHQNTAGKKLRFFGPMNITIGNHQCFKKNKTHKTLTLDHATISWIGNYGESTPDPCTLQSFGAATIIELERWYLTHQAPPQKHHQNTAGEILRFCSFAYEYKQCFKAPETFPDTSAGSETLENYPWPLHPTKLWGSNHFCIPWMTT